MLGTFAVALGNENVRYLLLEALSKYADSTIPLATVLPLIKSLVDKAGHDSRVSARVWY
jgi:hypothetical protein